MLPLSQTRRIVTWIGTMLCLAIAVAFSLTPWWWFGFEFGGGAICVMSGSIHVSNIDIDQWRWRYRSIRFGRNLYAPTAWAKQLGWFVSVQATPGMAAPYVIVPLWIPFAMIAVPTGIVWYRGRRPPPGHCRKCGYDLTGNISGICPECGTPIPREGEKP